MKKVFLFLLSLVGVLSVQAQTSPYTGSEVGEGDFYLYNVGTGLWIQNIDANNRRSDDNWNTGAGMGTAGFDFKLTAVDGGYNLDPKEAPNKFGWGYGDGGVMYLDGNIGGNTHWDFAPVEGVSNGYKISIDDHVLGVEVVDGKSFLINNATENDVWQLVTKAERFEKMKTIVSEGKPYDLSFLLGDWNFATNNTRRSQWVEQQDGGNNDGYPRARRWNSSHLVWNTNSYSWTQVIEGLPDGLYQFSVQGMYRDGSRNEVGAKAAAGTTNLIAKYFIGGSEASLMSMLAQASETQGDGFATAIENTDPQLYAPDNADNWTIVWGLHPDKYWNEPVKVNVRGGSVEVGVRKTSRINGDWLAMNEFKLEYVGPIDATVYKEALQAAITAAEGFTGNTTTALATALTTALSEAKALVDSEDIDAIEAKTNALNGARTAAEAVDVTNLNAVIALAKAAGIDVSAAETVVAEATEAAPVNNALSTLRLARQLKAAETAENVWAGNEAAAGDFYIYNVGSGRFLCGGDDWGAHAAIGFPGVAVTLIADGDNFQIDTHLSNGGEKHYLNYGGYMDTDGKDGWFFQPIAEGSKVFNIVRGGDHALLLGYSANTYARVDTDKSEAADPNNQWILVTKADRDALIADATKDKPVDVSYLIQSPGFNQREVIDNWKMEGFSIWGRGGNNPDFICESWNTTSSKLTQTIENLPAGLYQVSVQGFYRDGSTDQQVIVAADRAQLATFSANGESVLLPNILEGADKVPGEGRKTSVGEISDNANQSATYFRNGLYKNSLTVLVGEDGKLEISISKDKNNFDGDWIVVDNFRLKYLGNDEAEVAYMRALKAIEDKGTYRIFTEVEEGKKLYLNASGKLVDSAKKAATFTFNAVNANGTLYATGWNLGSKFTNPSLSNGSTGDVVQKGGINVGSNDRNDWERQVLFLNAEGKFAIRATNANSANWGANTYWDCVEFEELPAAGYSLSPAYVWQIEANVDNRPAAWAKTQTWPMKFQQMFGLVQDATNWATNAQEGTEGPIANLIDLNTGTFFHSQWSGTGPDEDHYIEATLPEDIENFYISFTKRNDSNRPIQIDVTGGESETQTITEGLPAQAWYTAAVNLTAPANIVRFTVPKTNMNGGANNGHQFFTFGEFYILPKNELITAAAPYMVGNDYTDLDTDPAIIEAIDSIDAKVSELAEYYAALAKIEDGAAYRIFTNVGETPYYLTADGKLTDDKTASGSFVFAKVEGEEFPYGFNLKDSYFTNPPQGGNPKLDNGQIATDPTSKRATWEAQVFFLKNGKYAVRATNAAGAESGWGLNATAFWTVNNGEDTPVAEYSFDKNYIWELEDMSTIKVTYVMFDAEGTQIGDPVVAVQEIGSEVKVPAEFQGAGYYAYTADKEGTVTEECTIKITRTYKQGLVLALDNLSNAKAYTITCDRGALLTNEGNIATTGHKDLATAEPANFAIISYNENYYLYSVADQKFVTNTGALAEMPTNGEKDAIKMDPKTTPYYMYYFTVAEGTNYGLNTNGTGAPWGVVINNWMNADAGNQYYMIEAADFDATEALAALDAYFNPSCVVTYIVKDAAGKELFTSEPEPAMLGSKITTLPAAYQRAFTTYNEVDVTIEAAETTIVFTATSTFPFELSSDFATAKWYNMTIRGEWWVGTEGKEDGEGIPVPEPYYPVQQTEDDAELLRNPAYQWAFTGDAYNGIIVWNKGAGAGFTLTSADEMAVMREGEYHWTIGQNSDGFTLRETGTEFNCINQNGGAGGPLSFWKSSGSLGDNGSTFRIFDVPAADPVEFTIKENMNKTGIGSGTQEAPTKVKINAPFKLQATAKNKAANNLQDEDLTIHFDMIMVSAFKDATWAPTGFNAVVLQDVNVPYAQYFEIPITFSEEYPFIQSINFVGAKLMKGDEVIDEVDVEEVGTPALVVSYIEIVDANGNSFVNDGIKSIFDENAENVFDLSGRKVQKVQKGRAYIIDGKKAVIRKK
ncbi:MAG: hypothetical protein K6G70_10025 [Bacteroidaceae bacterium]|nr:hypothetical protein [Bacteroidaceae bacterium]